MYTVYTYAVRLPDGLPNHAVNQLYMKTRYWNRLVELEQTFRTAVDEELSPHVSLALLEGPDGLTAYSDARKAALARDDIKLALREADARRKEAQRQARQDSGLYWGNYLDVDASYQDARKRNPRSLRFHRSAPEGLLSVWFQKGLPVADLYASRDSRLHLSPPPPPASDSRSDQRKSARHRPFRLRLGTDEDKTPILLYGTVTMHRPLPDGGVVRRASLVVERIGHHYRYSLQLVTAVAAPPVPSSDERVAAVDLGWRMEEDGGLRVAVAVNSEGERAVLRLDARRLEAFAKIRDLGSIRDNDFNTAKGVLAEWARGTSVPDWLRDELARRWQKPSTLAALYAGWRDNRFEGDEPGFEPIRAWRRQDRHLWEWESHGYDQLRTRRRERYRRFAYALTKTAGTIVLKRFDLRKVTGGDEYPRAARNRAIAAVGLLENIIRTTAAREGVAVVSVDSAYTTVDCSWCGYHNDYDAAASIMVRCEHCGREYDQDENACRNMLARYASDGQSRSSPRSGGGGTDGKTDGAGEGKGSKRFGGSRRRRAASGNGVV